MNMKYLIKIQGGITENKCFKLGIIIYILYVIQTTYYRLVHITNTIYHRKIIFFNNVYICNVGKMKFTDFLFS